MARISYLTGTRERIYITPNIERSTFSAAAASCPAASVGARADIVDGRLNGKEAWFRDYLGVFAETFLGPRPTQ